MPTLDEQLVEVQNKINTINTLKAKREVILAQISSYGSADGMNPLAVLILGEEEKQLISNDIVARLNVELAGVESELATVIGAGV